LPNAIKCLGKTVAAWQTFDQAQGLEQVPQPWNASMRACA